MTAALRSLAFQIGEQELGRGAGGLLVQLAQSESGFNPTAVSKAGAGGLTQLMPDTARDLGVTDVNDPEQNLRGGARFLRRQIDRFGNLQMALAAYNAGPAKVAQLVQQRGAQWATGLPDETKQYLSNFGYGGVTMGGPVPMMPDDGSGNTTQGENGLGGGPLGREYTKLTAKLIRDERYKQALETIHEKALNVITHGGATLDPATRKQFASLGLAGLLAGSGSGLDKMLDQDAPIQSVLTAVRAEMDHVDKAIDSGRGHVVDFVLANPEYQSAAVRDLGNTVALDIVKRSREVFGSQHAFQPAPMQFQVLPDGEVISFDPNSGSIKSAGNFPSAVAKSIQVDKSGNLVAIDPHTGDVKTLVEGFGQPTLDPKLAYDLQRRGVDLQQLQFQASTAIGLGGLELQRRGMMVQALGTDMSNEIQIGQMTYQEANLNLERMDKALAQRNASRAVLLKYAVNPSSVRTDESGNRVTRLPFSQELSKLTGADIKNFDLPVGDVNPEADRQAVLDASQYTSPIPGLVAQLESTRARISDIVGAPLAAEQTAKAAVDKVAGGL